MAIKLDGQLVSEKVRQQIKEEIADLLMHNQRAPHCAVIIVGDNEASMSYVANKEKTMTDALMSSSVYRLGQTTTLEEIVQLITILNEDDDIDGILVQLPLPAHLDELTVIEAINPEKDVDGLTYYNQGRLYDQRGLEPCTPAGIMELLKQYEISLEAKHVVVIGRSKLVGRPIAQLCTQANATVTICHSKTANLDKITKQADVLIVAVGDQHYIKPEFIKPGAVIVDVGIHRDKLTRRLTGDVDPRAYLESSYYTPVPKGVGPMTIAMLMRNTVEAYKRKKHDR